MVDVTVLGISLQDDGSLPVLLLHPLGTRRILSVGVSPIEAVAVSTALHGVSPFESGRSGPPVTHELLLSAVKSLGAELAAVEIVGCPGSEFSAQAVFAHNGGHVRVACRPADGVAMALRSGAPVRCARPLLDKAESIEAVMATLPEHVRTLAVAKFSEQGGRDTPDWLRIPLAVEEALVARARKGAKTAHEDLVSVARKMLEEDARWRSETQAERRAHRVILDPKGAESVPEKTKTTARTPQIRVTMVRHTAKGEADIINEFEVPAGDIPNEVLTGLGLSRKETEAVNGALEDERWAMLLRMLAPSTKVPM